MDMQTLNRAKDYARNIVNQMSGGSLGVAKANLNAIAVPTATDDSTKGYSIGSTWIYDSVTYICTNASVSGAIWTSSADIFYFDTWDALVAEISQSGTTYVNKYAIVANANGGVIGGATYTAPNALVNYIVDGGQSTYKVNTQGTNYSVTCQARTVSNPVITSVMTVATVKPTTSGYYIFTVTPTNSLPIGVNLNDIAYLNGTNWSLFQNYSASNAVVIVGTTPSSQVAWRKRGGSWVNTNSVSSYIKISQIANFATATATNTAASTFWTGSFTNIYPTVNLRGHFTAFDSIGGYYNWYLKVDGVIVQTIYSPVSEMAVNHPNIPFDIVINNMTIGAHTITLTQGSTNGSTDTNDHINMVATEYNNI